MTQEQIKRALAQLYWWKNNLYQKAWVEADEAAQNGDHKAFMETRDLDTCFSCTLNGICLAAQALGIGMVELMDEVYEVSRKGTI